VTARDEVDDELKRLAGETESITASVHFSRRVMDALPPMAPAGTWSDVTIASKWLVPVFAFAAVVAVVWAVSAEAASSELVASTETAELEW
jgi:hypothetical protein